MLEAIACRLEAIAIHLEMLGDGRRFGQLRLL